jgi:cytoskeletal protein CcmA (bactofilin family)
MSDHQKRDDGFRPNEANVAYVGEGVILKGEFTIPDSLVVDGVMEGDITARSIRVGASGVVKGNIVTTEADVHGAITERLEVKQLLTIRSSGRIDGTVSYGEVLMEKGAVITGTLSSTDFRSEKKQRGEGRTEHEPSRIDKLKVVQEREHGSSRNTLPTPDLKPTGTRE